MPPLKMRVYEGYLPSPLSLKGRIGVGLFEIQKNYKGNFKL
jgi:hypothetical protein